MSYEVTEYDTARSVSFNDLMTYCFEICDYDDDGSVAESLIDRIIKRHESSKPKPEPLTKSEISLIVEDILPSGTVLDLVRAIEKAHGIGD